MKRLGNSGLLFAVDVAENEIFILGFEFWRAENILLQLLAPRSPISIEVNHHQLVGSRRSGFGLF